MNLFNIGKFTLSSGLASDFKIDCDLLTEEDVESLAYLISKKYSFSEVYGIPTGGTRLEEALEKYKTTGPILLVDDVYTTGKSLQNFIQEKDLDEGNIIAIVLFSREPNLPFWVDSVFTMWGNDETK